MVLQSAFAEYDLPYVFFWYPQRNTAFCPKFGLIPPVMWSVIESLPRREQDTVYWAFYEPFCHHNRLLLHA